MTQNKLRLGRRSALLLPLGLAGCGLFNGDWFGSDKPPLPGTRIAVMSEQNSLAVDKSNPLKVVLPPPTPNADWPQAGGVPSHDMGHPALGQSVAPAWSGRIGTGGGYRRKLTAQPVVSGGRVFTMDSDAVISAFDVTNGHRAWDLETRADDDRSTNIGGGLAIDGGTLYAATGRGDVLAIAPATGKITWRRNIGVPARAAPTIAEDKLFLPTLGGQLLALSVTDGKQVWNYQATSADTLVLGLPSPGYSDGLIVAGFGSGELVALRANSGAVAWSDSLASERGRNSLSDLSTIRGRPVIRNGRVYAIGLGDLMVALDLRSGRRLWERDVASYETPWIAGDWLFILDQDNILAALSTVDGAVAWATQLDKFKNMKKQQDPIRWIGPVLAGDRLIVAGTNATALAVSPYTGTILGKQTLPGAASLSPIVAGGTLYLLTDDATLTAFR
ncbi:MAG TPA: PQQ-binding-like beta-propeller repeat protein [Acetobacteraceae bacterium]|jgi:outer membrane protein assembly factor BamB